VSQGQYVAAVYGVVFVVVLAYVAIIAAKLVRLERQVAELLELAARERPSARTEVPSGDPAASRAS
jgi:CcmD family protein